MYKRYQSTSYITNMDRFISIMVLLLLLTISCKKEQKIDTVKNDLIAEGKVLIKQNSNILLDSLESYDMNILHPEGKLSPLKVALLDSVGINERFSHATFNCSTLNWRKVIFQILSHPIK